MARQRAVGPNGDPPRTIALRSGCLGQDARKGRGLDAGRPDDRVRRDALPAARRLDVHAVAVDARHASVGADLDAHALEPARGLPRQPIAERREDLLAGVEQEHVGARGVDRAEVLLERPVRELGDLSRDLATGRSAADDGEGKPPPALGLRRRRLGQLERREYPPAQVERVVDRLHRERVLGELLVAEVRGRGSGGDDQAVVGERALASPRPDGEDRPVLDIEAGDLGQLDVDVLVLAHDAPERRRDLAHREDSRRDLVEQRLKEVVVRTVDERDLDVALAQELRGEEAAEAAADDDHAMAPSRAA